MNLLPDKMTDDNRNSKSKLAVKQIHRINIYVQLYVFPNKIIVK